jgi:hypothetical protein
LGLQRQQDAHRQRRHEEEAQQASGAAALQLMRAAHDFELQAAKRELPGRYRTLSRVLRLLPQEDPLQAAEEPQAEATQLGLLVDLRMEPPRKAPAALAKQQQEKGREVGGLGPLVWQAYRPGGFRLGEFIL